MTMVAVCLALTFPYDSLHTLLLLRLSENTGLQIVPERWNIQLPAGLLWTHPSIQLPGLARIDAEQLKVELKLGSVLRGAPVLSWSGGIGESEKPNGRVKGELSLASLSLRGPAQVLGNVEHLDLSHLALPFLKAGVLQGLFERRWADLSHADGSRIEGLWHIELTEVILEQLPFGAHVISSLGLSALSGRIECHQNTCRLESLKAENQDGIFSGHGELILLDPLSSSRLTLTLSAVMTEAMKEQLHLTNLGPATPGLPQKITITGPLSKLQIS